MSLAKLLGFNPAGNIDLRDNSKKRKILTDEEREHFRALGESKNVSLQVLSNYVLGNDAAGVTLKPLSLLCGALAELHLNAALETDAKEKKEDDASRN
jgi:hypothetical protein